MSEDQIRNELLTIRHEISKTNEDLTKIVADAHKETLSAVDAKIDKLIDVFKVVLITLFSLVVGFGGWLALDHLKLKEEHSGLRSDFGVVLKITSEDHKECIGFQELVDKYFPARGKQQKP